MEKHVGERIKELRKRLSLSAEKLASMINVSPATIYRWEKGHIEKVPATMLEPLADALQTTPEYLMGWETIKPKVVSTDPWDPDDLAYAEKDDNIRIMGRGYKRLSPENRALLLQIAKKMFAEDFDEEGNKKT